MHSAVGAFLVRRRRCRPRWRRRAVTVSARMSLSVSLSMIMSTIVSMIMSMIMSVTMLMIISMIMSMILRKVPVYVVLLCLCHSMKVLVFPPAAVSAEDLYQSIHLFKSLWRVFFFFFFRAVPAEHLHRSREEIANWGRCPDDDRPRLHQQRALLLLSQEERRRRNRGGGQGHVEV